MIDTKGFALVALLLTATACGKGDDDAQRTRVEREMKQWIADSIRNVRLAAEDLQRAAPVPPSRGWDSSRDAAALAAMKSAWWRARDAYELVEGAVAPLFPESDLATDARYDDFLLTLGAAGDPRPFDGEGVIGVHAIERILWADSIPQETLAFEQGLPGYRPASFPQTAEEARAFKEGLAGRWITDLEQLQQQLAPLELDIAFVFRGLMDLTAEQLEKVDRASTGREESRYAESTLRDLRANREGCLLAYQLFRPWLLARGHGALDTEVQAGFERLGRAYEALPGVAIPRPPRGWSSLEPQAQHAATPFGALFTRVSHETDETRPGSLAASLMRVADALSLPKAILR